MVDVATGHFWSNVIGQFLEATVHEILHLRSIYSQELFTRHRLYSIMVRKSRHPQLNEYIRSIVQSMQAPLVQGLLGKVAVLILDSRGRVVEKYVVQLQCHLKILASLDVEDVEAALRGCLLKLQFADACLKPARKGCTFEVVAYATERSALPVAAWVEGEPESPGSPASCDGDGPVVVPIKSASVGGGAFKLQLFAEC